MKSKTRVDLGLRMGVGLELQKPQGLGTFQSQSKEEKDMFSSSFRHLEGDIHDWEVGEGKRPSRRGLRRHVFRISEGDVRQICRRCLRALLHVFRLLEPPNLGDKI